MTAEVTMKLFRFGILSYCVASATFVLGASASLAAQHPHSSGRPPALELQVLLDRAGFSPGEIDGKPGNNSRKAAAAFRKAHKLAGADGNPKALLEALGAGTIHTTESYTITAKDAAGPFLEIIPEDMIEKSKLPSLPYHSLLEALGEKFHSSPSLLKQLNPGAGFTEGEQIQVPNVDTLDESASPPTGPVDASAKPISTTGRRGRPQLQSDAVKVVVSKKQSVLNVYDAKGQIIFHAPVTSGSQHDPLPLGDWKVMAVVHNPTFNYNPALFWDADPAAAKAKLPAGPNGPVGTVWIDLNKQHYGIHGTPEPGRIGYSTSHGCVRLTNWDAEKLASLVRKGTRVVFEE
jgi:lipoprotein-anchoring transpeptidase ErfK/SrfK